MNKKEQNRMIGKEQNRMIGKGVTRPFLLIKINGSYKRILPQNVVSLAKEHFKCLSIVISQKRNLDGQKTFDYVIGLHTENASKNTYKKKYQTMFPEILASNVHAEAKKGIGAWARALCANEFTIISCFGELNEEELRNISRQSLRKKGLFEASPPRDREVIKVKEPTLKMKKGEGFTFSLRKFCFYFLYFIKKTLFKLLTKTSFGFFNIKRMYWVIISHALRVLTGFSIFLYILYYKDGIHLTPEMLERVDSPFEFLGWLLKFWESGLPPKWTTEPPSFLSLIYKHSCSLLSLIYRQNCSLVNKILGLGGHFTKWIVSFWTK